MKTLNYSHYKKFKQLFEKTENTITIENNLFFKKHIKTENKFQKTQVVVTTVFIQPLILIIILFTMTTTIIKKNLNLK